VTIPLKSGSLNLLETSGPVQVCKGIAFTCYHDQLLSKITRNVLYDNYDDDDDDNNNNNNNNNLLNSVPSKGFVELLAI
jgi:hypothetical protein